MNPKPHTYPSPKPVDDDTVKSADRRSCAVFAITVTAALALVATLNVIVDPYAQYFGGAFQPLVQTSREQKVQMLRELASEPAERQPDALVLGSSRVLKFEPDYLEAQFGSRFFNAGVNYGKTEDALALLKFYQATFGRAPEMVVLGLDVNSFSNVSPPDARLLSQRELATQVTDYLTIDDRMQRWKSLLSWQQTKSSLKSLKLQATGGEPPEPHESFRKDGLIEYHQRMQQIAAGEYDFAGALDYNKHEYRSLFHSYDQISERRQSAFFEIVELCRSADSRLIVLLTPLHPELWQELSQSPNYANRKQEVTSMLDQAARFFNFEFRDFSDPESFAGDASEFVDGIHPLESNTRRMIRILAASGNDPDDVTQPHFISR